MQKRSKGIDTCKEAVSVDVSNLATGSKQESLRVFRRTVCKYSFLYMTEKRTSKYAGFGLGNEMKCRDLCNFRNQMLIIVLF